MQKLAYLERDSGNLINPFLHAPGYPRYKIWLVDCGVHYREYCGVQYRECAQDQMVYVDDLRLIPLGRTVHPDDAKLWPHLGRGP